MENEWKVEGACYCIELRTKVRWREVEAQKVRYGRQKLVGNEQR